MLKWIKKNNGLTLVEILVSLAILSIIIVPLSSMFLTTFKTNHKSKDILMANQLAQKYMEKLKAQDLSTMVQGEKTYTDTDTGMVIKTQIIPYVNIKTDENYQIAEENGNNNPIQYDVMIRFEDGYVIFESMGSSPVIISKNEAIHVDMTVDLSNIHYEVQIKGNKTYIDIDSDVNELNMLIYYDGKNNILFDIEKLADKNINIFTKKTGNGNKELKINGDVNVNPPVTPPSGGKTINLLFKITVEVYDANGTDLVSKLVSLKKID